MAHIVTRNNVDRQVIDPGCKELAARSIRAVARQNSVRDVPLVVMHGTTTIAQGCTSYGKSSRAATIVVIIGFSLISMLWLYIGAYGVAGIALLVAVLLWPARHYVLKRIRYDDEAIVESLMGMHTEREEAKGRVESDQLVKFVAWCCRVTTYPDRVSKHDLLLLLPQWVLHERGALPPDEHRWLMTSLQYTGEVRLQRVRTKLPSVYAHVMRRYIDHQAVSPPSDADLYEWNKRLGDQADTVRGQVTSDTVIHAAYQLFQMIAEQREHPAYSRHVEHGEEMVRVVARVRRQASLYLVPAYKELEEQAEAAHASLLAVKNATNWG